MRKLLGGGKLDTNNAQLDRQNKTKTKLQQWFASNLTWKNCNTCRAGRLQKLWAACRCNPHSINASWRKFELGLSSPKIAPCGQSARQTEWATRFRGTVGMEEAHKKCTLAHTCEWCNAWRPLLIWRAALVCRPAPCAEPPVGERCEDNHGEQTHKSEYICPRNNCFSFEWTPEKPTRGSFFGVRRVGAEGRWRMNGQRRLLGAHCGRAWTGAPGCETGCDGSVMGSVMTSVMGSAVCHESSTRCEKGRRGRQRRRTMRFSHAFIPLCNLHLHPPTPDAPKMLEKNSSWFGFFFSSPVFFSF